MSIRCSRGRKGVGAASYVLTFIQDDLVVVSDVPNIIAYTVRIM